MNRTVKVGAKQRHVSIPVGWVQVTEGVCKDGDKFCNLRDFHFSLCEADDVGLTYDNFDLLIRPCTTCGGCGIVRWSQQTKCNACNPELP